MSGPDVTDASPPNFLEGKHVPMCPDVSGGLTDPDVKIDCELGSQVPMCPDVSGGLTGPDVTDASPPKFFGETTKGKKENSPLSPEGSQGQFKM